MAKLNRILTYFFPPVFRAGKSLARRKIATRGSAVRSASHITSPTGLRHALKLAA